MLDLIVLDMDGVLADFVSGTCALFGMPSGWQPSHWDFYDDFGVDARTFWAKVSMRPDFWLDLEPTPWKDELVSLAQQHGREWVIATSPAIDPSCWQQKVAWVYEHVDACCRNLVVTPQKHLLSAPGRVLIDDSDHNVEKWRAAGGTAILFPTPWNENRGLADDPITYTKGKLEDVAEDWARR